MVTVIVMFCEASSYPLIFSYKTFSVAEPTPSKEITSPLNEKTELLLTFVYTGTALLLASVEEDNVDELPKTPVISDMVIDCVSFVTVTVIFFDVSKYPLISWYNTFNVAEPS